MHTAVVCAAAVIQWAADTVRVAEGRRIGLLTATGRYDAAAVVAKESAKRGVSVRDIVLEKELLPADKIDEALDVRGMTEPGLPD